MSARSSSAGLCRPTTDWRQARGTWRQRHTVRFLESVLSYYLFDVLEAGHPGRFPEQAVIEGQNHAAFVGTKQAIKAR